MDDYIDDNRGCFVVAALLLGASGAVVGAVVAAVATWLVMR